MSSPSRTTASSAARASSRARVMADRTLTSDEGAVDGASGTAVPGDHVGQQLLGAGLGERQHLLDGGGHRRVDGPGIVAVDGDARDAVGGGAVRNPGRALVVGEGRVLPVAVV